MSTAKSLFIRRERDIWESVRSQRVALTEANERLAQRSTEVADLRLLCDELKSEAVSAQAEALSAREQVASQAEEMQQRQLELGQVIGERDQSRSQAVEAVSRAEALRGQLAEAIERLAEASARARTLAESLAVAVGSAQSAQAVASQQCARAEGMFCPLCDFVFVSILHLATEESCPAVCRIRIRLLTRPSRTARRLPRRLSRRRPSVWPCPRLSRPFARPSASTASPWVAPPESSAGLGRPCAQQTPRGTAPWR